MLIFLNPYAGGGTAQTRWARTAPAIRRQFGPFELHMLSSAQRLSTVIEEELQQGERFFVAAGGDGTVQRVLQALLTVDGGAPDDVCLGAIGLGSSNDFHKPRSEATMIRGVPCALDREQVMRRDVGVLATEAASGERVTQYWLLNSSLGVTAEANAFFNAPDMLLTRLKAWSTPAAILYAALHTILLYRNQRVRLRGNELADVSVHLTNLAILKSPHCSGALCYEIPFEPSSGLLHVHLSEAMTLPRRLMMLLQLARHRTKGLAQTRSWTTDGLCVEADTSFAVEFDGEVLQTRRAQFTVCPRRLWVCS